ncbi:MAG: ATP-binding protein [Deltaproteobacteria bacterium]|nr:ATP-binding protein [Deltaproteobacteria bacterium]
MKIPLSAIHHDRHGFLVLAGLHAQTADCFLDDVEIDMRATDWLDADMCAALGAILYGLEDNLNTVRLTHIRPAVESILSKNGFLSHYGRTKVPDHWGTTISYKRFDADDDRYFARYIEDEFIQRSEIPEMSTGLRKKFCESIFEIFSNAVLHSRTKLGIFSCGQFFPTRSKLDFCVADLGVGIQRNVHRHTGVDLAPEEAIEWATQANNTTKRGDVPGGLGLKLLCEFIDLNGGSLQIVSDAGYWRRKNRRNNKARLRNAFPGTVVSVEIDTADRNSYRLSSELETDDIF